MKRICAYYPLILCRVMSPSTSAKLLTASSQYGWSFFLRLKPTFQCVCDCLDGAYYFMSLVFMSIGIGLIHQANKRITQKERGSVKMGTQYSLVHLFAMFLLFLTTILKIGVLGRSTLRILVCFVLWKQVTEIGDQ